jgi:hypothetical protein
MAAAEAAAETPAGFFAAKRFLTSLSGDVTRFPNEDDRGRDWRLTIGFDVTLTAPEPGVKRTR